jgi:hypothetical protein
MPLSRRSGQTTPSCRLLITAIPKCAMTVSGPGLLAYPNCALWV